MKLRLRSLETKQTLKIELPNSSTLQQLKQILSQSLSSSSSLHLFLNRIYDLHASSPEASLQSLGIISGDLIFFTLTPDKKTLEHEISDSKTDINMSDSTTNLLQEDEETSGSGPSGAESMEFDNGSSVLSRKKYFEHYFLRRVLREELGNGVRSDHKLMVIAVHAVLLESGFVGLDSVSGMPVDRLHLPDVWPSKPFTLCYTLPYNVAESESIDLKFQHVGHCINIYGSLPKGGSGLHRVCLNENRFVPALESLWAANSDSNNEINNQEGYLEIEVFEFWKTVKDDIALPLLIDLCEMAGLVLPPCLMRLPPDLKLKIFESLPVVDLVKVGCVCSELQNLSTSNELWKQKFVEEFGNGTGAKGWIHWKINFKSFWERKKKRKREREGRILRVFPQVPVPIPLWRPSPSSPIIWNYPRTIPVTQSFYNHGPVLEVNPLVEIRKL